MVDIVFSNTTKVSTFTETWFRRIINEVVSHTPFSGTPVELSVNVVGEKKMQSLNARFRRQNKPTDVLSFPLQEDLRRVAAQYKKVVPMGDLFICLPVAEAKAREENTTLEKKMRWLTIHGTLHLLGYDHEASQKEARLMEEKETAITESLT